MRGPCRFAGGLAVWIMLFAGALRPAGAVEGIDVFASSPSSSSGLLIASVRDDEVSCLSLLGPQSWLVLTPSSGAVSVVNAEAGSRTELSEASIAGWRDALARGGEALRETLVKARAGPALTREAADVIDGYLSSAPRATIPRIKPVKEPMRENRSLKEMYALNQRLGALRKELRKQLPSADLAGRQLACALEFDELPTQFSAPNSPNKTLLSAQMAENGRPRWVFERMKTSTDLSRLFTLRSALAVPASVVAKP